MLLTPHTKIRAATQRPTRSATGPNDFQHGDLDEIGADCSAGDLTHGATSTTPSLAIIAEPLAKILLALGE